MYKIPHCFYLMGKEEEDEELSLGDDLLLMLKESNNNHVPPRADLLVRTSILLYICKYPA